MRLYIDGLWVWILVTYTTLIHAWIFVLKDTWRCIPITFIKWILAVSSIDIVTILLNVVIGVSLLANYYLYLSISSFREHIINVVDIFLWFYSLHLATSLFSRIWRALRFLLINLLVDWLLLRKLFYWWWIYLSKIVILHLVISLLFMQFNVDFAFVLYLVLLLEIFKCG